MSPELSALELADAPERWEALGFTVSDRGCDVVGMRLHLAAHGRGITRWTLAGVPGGTVSIDGLPTALASDYSATTPPYHPNGAIAIDHVVVTTPDFNRTSAALQTAAMPLRRVAERPDGRRMGFRRLGPAILELVETKESQDGPARFWGLVVVVEDLDALADRLGERLGSIHDAVQPGRRIATLRESAGLGQAVAFISRERVH